MKPFNILFFENEFSELKPAFDMVNAYFYKGMLNYKVLPQSQSLTNLQDVKEYDLIIVDIDLSGLSNLDGYGVIAKIKNEISELPPIVIVSGHEKNLDIIKKYNLGMHQYIEKPIKFKEIQKLVDTYKKE